MDTTPTFALVSTAHLVVLALWGGVVATEAVLEVAPFRRPELHPATIRLHYWIDLLVELPLVLAVVATGITLVVLADSLSARHVVKLVFAGGAVAVNLFCIGVVLRRARALDGPGAEARRWRASRIVLACFAVGLACAAVAAVLGFTLAFARHLPGGG